MTWAAQVTGGAPGTYRYRYRARDAAGQFHVVRDFSPVPNLDWSSLDEGAHEVELTVRILETGETVSARATYELETRVAGGMPLVSPTSHPLIFLFSAPACDAGQARVRFEAAGRAARWTPARPCVSGRSLNFTLAGLAPETAYSASLLVRRGRTEEEGPAVSFRTGSLPDEMDPPLVLQAPAPGSEGLLLQFPLFLPAIATDLNGTVLWYGPGGLTYCTHFEEDGTIFGLFQPGTGPADEVVRRFDLLGFPLKETSVERVNQQLVAAGKRPISGFHHEARTLPGGKTLVLAGVEQILTGVQGPGPVDVLGDTILVLDEDLQVLWTWDAFDHLDTRRAAVGGETCQAFSGCPTHYLAEDANDWTHGNSVVLTPDGNLLYSSRHQDWVLKIDYRDGGGDGRVIWRLGKDGDFALENPGEEPYPWFSHQHDAGYEPGSRSTILLFDNGNTRKAFDPAANSRGQAIELDEERRTARLVFNADLGVYSAALGSAQKLPDGSYHFDIGFVFDPDGFFTSAGLSVQIDPLGNVVSSLKLLLAVYRSYRIADLYGASASVPSRGPSVLDFRP